MTSGGFASVLKNVFGIDNQQSGAAATIAGLTSSTLLGLGSLGTAFLSLPAMVGLEGLFDVLDVRRNEGNKDTLESIFGNIGGRLMYGAYLNDPTDQLEVTAMAAQLRQLPGDTFESFFAAQQLFDAGMEDWPGYQDSMASQMAAMQARSDFFKYTDAGKFLAGRYYQHSDDFPRDVWEANFAQGMGQYGMYYQDPRGWSPVLDLQQYVAYHTGAYLDSQGIDDSIFTSGTIPSFTVDPAGWIFNPSSFVIGQVPDYISSADYWNAMVPPDYFGVPGDPLAGVFVDPGTYYSPDYRDLGGMRTGGIASGPTSGYNMKLHGTEAVVPLPNGRSIPVEMNNSQRPIVHTHVYLDRKQIALAVGDELETNPRLKARYN
jgi:hypothetical protein